MTTPFRARRDEFLETRYWPALDGLRAVSILLVLTAHTHDAMWEWLHGSLGVTLFFVISGFLITTLLTREERRTGRVSLRGFYIRRVFRIVPLYALALLTAVVAVLVFNLGEGTSDFVDRLPLLATFNGEFAGSGTFSHSWSLGIEEKFYILWPLLGFATAIMARHRLPILSVALPVALVANAIGPISYVGVYLPIVGGCLLAVLADRPDTYRFFDLLARPVVAWATATLLVIALLTAAWVPHDTWRGYTHPVFALVAVVALPGLIWAPTVLRSGLSSAPMVRYGQRAYAIYLFHPFVLDVLDRALGSDESVPVQVLRFLLLAGISFLGAEIVGRLIETPMIKVGRRLARPKPPPA